MSLHTCTWCGHIHDPEDGRCDAHAHVGLGPCPCPGDDRRMVDRIVAWLRNPPGGADDVDLAYALRIEREFGDSAPIEDER